MNRCSVLLYNHITSKIWNDFCEAHEAYQFLRKKNSLKYGEFVPTPSYTKQIRVSVKFKCFSKVFTEGINVSFKMTDKRLNASFIY